jgi:hypothetical protein
MAKKKPKPQEFFLYSEGAAKKVQHQAQKKQLEQLRQKGDPRQKNLGRA